MANRMRNTLLVALVALTLDAAAQSPTAWRDSLTAYWARLDAEFADSATSPLTAGDRALFQHLEHFPFDSTYHLVALFVPATDTTSFAMRTTRTRTPMYRTYGTLRFTLNGAERTLNVYQSVPPHPGYEDMLFVPFTDLTNGAETYGVGRYLDLSLPMDSTVTLDFNRAYNPYCAYNDRYSCPVPPSGNHLATAVRAGVLNFREH